MNPTYLLLGFVYTCLMLFFTIAFLVIWLRRRQQLRPYFPYGLFAGVTIVTLQLLTLIAGINTLLWSAFAGVLFIAFGVAIDFFKMIIFTAVGMNYAAELQTPSFPILSQMRSRASAGKAGEAKDHEGIENTSRQSSFWIHTFWIHTAVVTGFTILYSVVLFKLTNPQIGAPLQLLLGNETVSQTQILSLQNFLLVLVFAFGEEIIFRLGIQNFLAKHLNWQQERYWLAIVATSALWTLGHTGSLDPDWVKFAQIFPVGLLLGWLFRRQGIESCILAHGLFNVLLLPFTTQLVQTT